MFTQIFVSKPTFGRNQTKTSTFINGSNKIKSERWVRSQKLSIERTNVKNKCPKLISSDLSHNCLVGPHASLASGLKSWDHQSIRVLAIQPQLISQKRLRLGRIFCVPVYSPPHYSRLLLGPLHQDLLRKEMQGQLFRRQQLVSIAVVFRLVLDIASFYLCLFLPTKSHKKG